MKKIQSYTTAGMLSWGGASTRRTTHTPTTEDVGYLWHLNLWMLCTSYSIAALWTAMTDSFQNLWKWIGLTTIEDTNQETYDSQHGPKTARTLERPHTQCGLVWGCLSKPGHVSTPDIARALLIGWYNKACRLNRSLKGSGPATPVYDLVNAGPRHRFTTARSTVHNCLGLGYSMGTVRYAQTLVDARLVDNELKQGEVFKGVKPAKLPPEVREFLQYLKVPFNKAVWYYVYLRADKEVSEYRSSNPLIVKHWEQHDYWLKKSVLAKDPTHEIALRSNRVLTYYDPQFVKVELQTRPAVKARTEIGGALKFLHRGLLTNNEVQATSRDILCDAWRAIAAEGIRVLWTVHDEFIIEAPENEAKDILKRTEELMASSSPWADGCPLGVSGGITDMYLKD